MSRRTLALERSPAALDIVSHGRRGPGSRTFLSPAQVAQVARTVHGVPEVVVKVSGGARDCVGARGHFDYIDRHGRLPIETDEGVELAGRDTGQQLVEDWNLALSRGQYRPRPAQGAADRRPKLVHNIVLSMPGRTPAQAVLRAARVFAREHFSAQHRWALVLHTDRQHPHVHLVVKAEQEYEPQRRLHVTKALLRSWREDFAAALREQGVAANATPAALRGRPRSGQSASLQRWVRAAGSGMRQPDGDRAAKPPPRVSPALRAKVEVVASELLRGRFEPPPGKARLQATRQAVERSWLGVAAALQAQGEAALADDVRRFVQELPAVRTEQEQIAAALLAHACASRQAQQERPAPRARDG